MSEILANTIEVDLVTIDDDYEDYGSTSSGSTMTLMSAAKAYVFENGRRFHGWREVCITTASDQVITVVTDIELGSVCDAERRGRARQNGYATPYFFIGTRWRASRSTDCAGS